MPQLQRGEGFFARHSPPRTAGFRAPLQASAGKPAQVDFAYFAAFISALQISGMRRTSYEAPRLAG
jgi:hypothetical protein